MNIGRTLSQATIEGAGPEGRLDAVHEVGPTRGMSATTCSPILITSSADVAHELNSALPRLMAEKGPAAVGSFLAHVGDVLHVTAEGEPLAKPDIVYQYMDVCIREVGSTQTQAFCIVCIMKYIKGVQWQAIACVVFTFLLITQGHLWGCF